MGEFDTPRPIIELLRTYLPKDVCNCLILWCDSNDMNKELDALYKTPTQAVAHFDWDKLPHGKKYWTKVFKALYYGWRKVPPLPKGETF